MKPLVSLFILLAMSSAQADQGCGQEVEAVNISGTEKDSSGDVRQGVIAPKEFEASFTGMMMMAFAMQAGKKITQEDYSKMTPEIQKSFTEDYIKNATAMHFCQIKGQPASSAASLQYIKSIFTDEQLNSPEVVASLNQSLDLDQCDVISDIVGIRITANIPTPGSTVDINSVEVNGIKQDVVSTSDVINIDETNSKDICFKNAQMAEWVTLYGTSSNSEGSRGNIQVQLLKAAPAQLELK